MAYEAIVFRTGLTRVFLGFLAYWLLPLMYPSGTGLRALVLAYVVFAVIEQLLIWRHIGGRLRSFLAGLVDLVVLTYLIHRVGSFSTPLVCLYFLSAVLNSLAVGKRVGLALGFIGAFAYASVVAAERLGLLPYAPDGMPGPLQSAHAVAGAAMVSSLLLAFTTSVVLLVEALRSRQAELQKVNAQLEALSQRDPLTQVYNRRYLFARLETELTRVGRGHPLAVVMLDLDGFKKVNDGLGHLHGDLFLREVAERLAKVTRAADTVGRYGGDEFVLLLPDTPPEQAKAVAERLVAEIRESGTRLDPTHPFTASAGVAMARADDSLEVLLRRADENLYAAKQAGGDRIIAAA